MDEFVFLESGEHPDFSDSDVSPSEFDIIIGEGSIEDVEEPIIDYDKLAESFAERNLLIQAVDSPIITSSAPANTDYYTYMDTWVADYFAGIVKQYPLSRWSATHLCDYNYISNAYRLNHVYKLYYDYKEGETIAKYIQITKPYDRNGYDIVKGSQTISLPTSNELVYGNYNGYSDFSGVNYYETYGILFAFAVVLILYILRNFFKFID